jgi:excisionase family DNA binding protein
MHDDKPGFALSTEVNPLCSVVSAAPSLAKRRKKASTTLEEPPELCTAIAVTIKQAARLIGTNDKQIRRAIYAREIQVVRLGKSYSIAVADLKRWFDRKKAFI